MVLGFNTAAEVFYARRVPRSWAAASWWRRRTGREGVRGFVTDAIRESGLAYDYFYACGPLPMLRALSDATKCSGQLSFEERMGCGFGACMGCSCKTKYGNKRICKEGPVLTKGGGDMVTKTIAATCRSRCAAWRLDNPVIPASGTFGFGQRIRAISTTSTFWAPSRFKGTTRDARFGNPTPRIAECTAGMINAVGSAEPGHRRRDRRRSCPACGRFSTSR